MLKMVAKTALLAGAMVLAGSAASRAADLYVPPVYVPPPPPAPWFDKTFGATITNNYVSRGFSQTDGGAAVQAFFEISTGILYAGVWASNVDYTSAGGAAGVEFDVSAGIRPTWGPLALDLGYVHYFYTNSAATDTGEIYAKANWTVVDPLTLGASAYWNPYQSTTYFEGNAKVEIGLLPAPWGSSISGAVGYVNAPASYWTWNIGKTITYADTISLDFRYHDTNISSPLWTVSLGFSTSLSKLANFGAGL